MKSKQQHRKLLQDSIVPDLHGSLAIYERGTPSLFTGAGRSIDTFYIDGVSVTHSSPRQHIWSFGGGLDEVSSVWACPCVTGSTAGDRISSFVGQNYFCESGITRFSSGYIFWPNGDPLWDG